MAAVPVESSILSSFHENDVVAMPVKGTHQGQSHETVMLREPTFSLVLSQQRSCTSNHSRLANQAQQPTHTYTCRCLLRMKRSLATELKQRMKSTLTFGPKQPEACLTAANSRGLEGCAGGPDRCIECHVLEGPCHFSPRKPSQVPALLARGALAVLHCQLAEGEQECAGAQQACHRERVFAYDQSDAARHREARLLWSLLSHREVSVSAPNSGTDAAHLSEFGWGNLVAFVQPALLKLLVRLHHLPLLLAQDVPSWNCRTPRVRPPARVRASSAQQGSQEQQHQEQGRKHFMDESRSIQFVRPTCSNMLLYGTIVSELRSDIRGHSRQL